MEVKVISIRLVYVDSSWCCLQGQELSLFLVLERGEETPLQREIYTLLLGIREESREFFCVLFLNCL